MQKWLLSVMACAALMGCDSNTADHKKQGDAPANQPLTVAGASVPASCFSLLLSDEEHPTGEGEAIPLAQCMRDDIKPLDASNPADYTYSYTSNTHATPDGRMRYNVVGKIADDTVIHYTETNTDETTPALDSLLRVTLTPQTIRLHSVYSNGNTHCADSITHAEVANNGVEYSTAATPNDVLQLLDNNAPQDLATDCSARIQYRDANVTRVILSPTAPPPLSQSACLQKAWTGLAQHNPQGMPLPVLKMLWAKEQKNCGG